jgi:thiamine biosynthesis lipoprotein
MEPGSRTLFARRDILRILAVGGLAGGAWGLGLLGGSRVIERSRVLMGTRVRLSVIGDDREAAAAAADATIGRMAQLEALLSRYRPGSEVWRLNETGRVEGASDPLLEVLRLADRVSRLGDGAFDVTIQPVLDLYREELARTGSLPSASAVHEAVARVDHRALRITGRTVELTRPGMRITLDGIGKGYVVDRGVAVLRQRGFADVFVEAGGDLVAAGRRVSGEPWRIGIRRARPGLALQARFEACDRAVATSGDYMQPFTEDYLHHHILDPRSGSSAPELASATVVAPDAATADALATLSMVLGPRKGHALLEDLPGCEGYLVAKNLEVTRTSGFTLT